MYAQDQSTEPEQKEEAPSYTPFAWYLEQEEQKEKFLLEKLDSLSLFNLRNRSKDDKKLVVILNMPIYEGPKGLSLMPVLPIDTTNTYYMKIYPVKE
jgi:hypothetical protein